MDLNRFQLHFEYNLWPDSFELTAPNQPFQAASARAVVVLGLWIKGELHHEVIRILAIRDVIAFEVWRADCGRFSLKGSGFLLRPEKPR